MKRKIIKIDESKCDGCGLCANGCPEGAIKIIDGKARLVGEIYCDGLGACIGNCPLEAITIEEREAQPYDERGTLDNIIPQGEKVIKAHLQHLKEHGQTLYIKEALEYLKERGVDVGAVETQEDVHNGCPGMKMIDMRKTAKTQSSFQGELCSELSQWPVQLHLLSPQAPYFNDSDLVIAADCVAFAYADFHRRFLKNKSLVIFCPKLDMAYDVYLDKLTAILKDNNIKSLTVVHMEVPCCYGAVKIAEEALKASGKNIIMKDYTISVSGEIV